MPVSCSAARQAFGDGAVGDEDVDPATEEGRADGGVLAHAARDADAAYVVAADLSRGQAEHALVEFGADRLAVLVEEPQADVADRTLVAQYLLLVGRHRVAALSQQRRRLQSADPDQQQREP